MKNHEGHIFRKFYLKAFTFFVDEFQLRNVIVSYNLINGVLFNKKMSIITKIIKCKKKLCSTLVYFQIHKEIHFTISSTCVDWQQNKVALVCVSWTFMICCAVSLFAVLQNKVLWATGFVMSFDQTSSSYLCCCTSDCYTHICNSAMIATRITDHMTW